MITTQSQVRLIGFLTLVLQISPRHAFPAPDGPPTGPRVVMIIRHAEKPDGVDGKKDPDLSKKGFERADALAKVIPDHFPRPDFLIATRKSKGSNRPVETLTPLSQTLHETIDSTFSSEAIDAVAHSVLTDPKYAGKTVLIAWHHGKIPDLAKALGAKNAPDQWNPAVFDRLWQISYENGTSSWKDLPERALPGDSEK